MNKKYTINNIEVTAEQIRDIIKNNPELVEEKVSGRYFFPKNGETYYVLLSTGDILNYVNDGDDTDKSVIELGVYRTEEEVELARDKQKAIVACWKWAEENAPFKPDWKNSDQLKHYAVYNHFIQEFYCDSSYIRICQSTLPYFKTGEGCEKFIEANKANLELLFTK